MQPVDDIISVGWVIPVDPPGTVLPDHSIVTRAGRVEAILPHAEAMQRYEARRRHDYAGHAAIPGLVNAHTHAAMTLFRGMAEDLPLDRWLDEHVWPAEQRWAGEAFVHDGTRLAAAEMLRSGTTCFGDMYYYPDVAGRAASAMGIRAVVGLIVLDFPTAWARDTGDYLAKATEVHDAFRDDPLVTTAFAPHAPYTVSDEGLARVAMLAEEMDVQVHMHVLETAGEVARSIEAHGERPLARLDRLGLLTGRLAAVHMTALDQEDIDLVADRAVNVVHCPESNLKLASGLCPVERLRLAGAALALGTDGAASNNDVSVLGEMRTASLLAKGVSGDAGALPAHAALRMATLGGARALGIEDRVGSLTPGKAADVVLVDLETVETAPVYNPVSQVIYAADRRNVTDVWVAGRRVVCDGELLTGDEAELCAMARAWRDRIIDTGTAG